MTPPNDGKPDTEKLGRKMKTHEDRLDGWIQLYDKGICTAGELVRRITELAVDLHPSVIVQKLPPELLAKLREHVRQEPIHPDKYVHICGILPSGPVTPPKPGDDDLKWYAGLWRLHLFFRSECQES
jgi:hypothetical protein